MKRLLAMLGFGGVVSLLASACVYDPDQRCGPRQVLLDNDRCACEPGYVPGDRGCEPCGDNEVERSGVCVCGEGFARSSDAAACEEIPRELGAECDPMGSDCSGVYPLCQATEDGSGYCTNECASSSDCDGGYRCQEGEEGSYCRRPPLGYGDSCESDRDCAGGEATYCEVFQTNICLVPCSAGNTDVCFVGEVCCNFVLFNPVCVPADACAPMGMVVE